MFDKKYLVTTIPEEDIELAQKISRELKLKLIAVPENSAQSSIPSGNGVCLFAATNNDLAYKDKFIEKYDFELAWKDVDIDHEIMDMMKKCKPFA